MSRIFRGPTTFVAFVSIIGFGFRRSAVMTELTVVYRAAFTGPNGVFDRTRRSAFTAKLTGVVVMSAFAIP